MNRTLAGLKVIEFAAIGPAPFAAMMLSDMGGDITRIDRASSNSPLFNVDGTEYVDRGRKSIAIDLKNPKGIEVALRLIKDADVLLEGNRPGVMERLGLGPDVCLALNPRLIYGRMTGWGQSGPLSHAAGHDLNYMAISGALHAMGYADRPPKPPLNLVGDYGGGAMLLLVGVLAALFERQRSGRGQVIDAAISDGVAALMAPIYSMLAQGKWKDERDANTLDGGSHFYDIYECADGRYVSIGSIEPQFYAMLLRQCGMEDVADFQRQLDPAAWPALKERLRTVFKSKTREEWCKLMEGTDICFAPVLSMAEAPQHPHNRARAAFMEVNGMMQSAPAPRFSRTPSQASSNIPQIGEHSVELLSAAGFSRQEIDGFLACGAVVARGEEQQAETA